MSRHHHTTHRARRGVLERRYRASAAIASAALALVTAFAYLQQNPIGTGYELRGVFASANQLRAGSDVRIAGVRVGAVRAIDQGPDGTALVTMRIDERGRPVRGDATLAVKPRLVLEGNAYVELRPGSPGSPELESGATLSIERTTVTPQLDQVLGVFERPTRESLHRSIAELAESLGKGVDRGRRGTGYDGLRRAVRELDGALASVTRVARAVRGTEPGDLGRAVRASGRAAAGLATSPRALAELVSNYDRVTGALAADDRALAASVRGFDDVLRIAQPSLRDLDAALPALTELGDALRPSLPDAPPALRATNALLAQLEAAMEPDELPALLNRLRPVTSSLPGLTDRLRTLFGHVTPVTDCIRSNIVPTLKMKIEPEGYPHATGDPVWLELLHAFTASTSFATSIDGNGGTIRLGITEHEDSFSSVFPGLGTVVGRGPESLGLRPTFLGYGVEPPYRPDQRCAEQELPDLSKRAGAPPELFASPVPDTGEEDR